MEGERGEEQGSGAERHGEREVDTGQNASITAGCLWWRNVNVLLHMRSDETPAWVDGEKEKTRGGKEEKLDTVCDM